MSPIPKREFKVQAPEDQATPDLPGLEIFSQGPAFAPPRRGGGLDVQNGHIKMGAFTLTDKGLQVDGSASPDDWSKVGDVLFKLEGSIQWLIGDWLAYGIELKYGEMVKIADHFGRDESTLHTYKQMAENIEYTRRRVDLPFSHHQEVRSLTPEQQDYALAYAAEQKLSRSDFRKWIKAQKGEAAPELPAESEAVKMTAGEFTHFFHLDPDRVKPRQRQQAHQVGREMMQAVRDYYRKWGIEE